MNFETKSFNESDLKGEDYELPSPSGGGL